MSSILPFPPIWAYEKSELIPLKTPATSVFCRFCTDLALLNYRTTVAALAVLAVVGSIYLMASAVAAGVAAAVLLPTVVWIRARDRAIGDLQGLVDCVNHFVNQPPKGVDVGAISFVQGNLKAFQLIMQNVIKLSSRGYTHVDNENPSSNPHFSCDMYGNPSTANPPPTHFHNLMTPDLPELSVFKEVIDRPMFIDFFGDDSNPANPLKLSHFMILIANPSYLGHLVNQQIITLSMFSEENQWQILCNLKKPAYLAYQVMIDLNLLLQIGFDLNSTNSYGDPVLVTLITEYIETPNQKLKDYIDQLIHKGANTNILHRFSPSILAGAQSLINSIQHNLLP